MADEYHELENVVDVHDSKDLTFPRTHALLGAVQRHRDYSLTCMLRHPVEGKAALECLVVDVECDDVPPKNPFGIRYRERLALFIPKDAKQLVEVLALRRDFPILMHQNQGVHNAPTSLCLYFESAASVMRTWTPQSFLRRIQWWLEKSARGELHPTDQPVEHLFFASKYELVLPWNLDELQQNPRLRFVVALRQERPDEGFTCFLEPQSEATRQGRTTKYIELTLPPILHGFVERDPATLGQLADLLEQREVDLTGPLRTALQDEVGQAGITAADSDQGLVILLHIPMRRNTDEEPSLIARRAFLVQSGTVELGAATGALMAHEGRYYKDLLNQEPSTAWRDHLILPMEVLQQNDVPATQRQSGTVPDGPKGVLIGAGSLGSLFASLWGRSGWGQWTVIDKDHIKPHNLSRHIAYTQHIGETKSTVVAGLHAAAMADASAITPIVADATDFSDTSVTNACQAADLVIDASTTLEYPRAASMIEQWPRQASAFITPNGNAAVLLAEDSARERRLRTLEAQYYRALIQSDWGELHLSGHTSTFWSGASCRDISMVMPYSRIMGHASTLAEQIQVMASQDEALIRIWQRDPQRGSVEVYVVPVAPERCLAFGELNLFIDSGVEQELRGLRQEGFPNETGGVLLGYYDFNINAVTVVACLPAPTDSKASPASFERGIAGLADAVQQASTRTAGMVGYIGEWHSHPPGHSASPSRDDIEQLVHLTLGMAEDGLPAIQLIVGEQDLHLLQGEVR
jgi:hypothetical protein